MLGSHDERHPPALGAEGFGHESGNRSRAPSTQIEDGTRMPTKGGEHRSACNVFSIERINQTARGGSYHELACPRARRLNSPGYETTVAVMRTVCIVQSKCRRPFNPSFLGVECQV